MKNPYELTDDFSLAVQLQELGRISDFFGKNVGGGKTRQQFMNSTNGLLNSMALEFSNRKLDMNLCDGMFWLFPPNAKAHILHHAASNRTDMAELQSVYDKLQKMIDRDEGESFSAVQIIKANLEKFEQFWTQPPDYLSKW